MKLMRIRLRGAIGIKEGLGVDEIDLNLEGLDGMVALDGDNGVGKTTVLDNLVPYRFLPSRKKKALQRHFFLRDSCRELELEHSGHHYRFLIKIDPEQGKSGKQEGFVYVDHAEGSVVDGKTGPYDEFVTNLFGTPDLFLASVFCAQKTDDSQMTVGDMKKQYAEFLRLHEMQAHSETSKRCEQILKSHIETVEQRLGQIMGQALALSDAPQQLEKKEADVKTHTEGLEFLRGAARQISNERDDLLKKREFNQVAKLKAVTIKDSIVRIKAEIIELQTELKATVDSREGIVRGCNAQIEECNKVVARKDEIEGAVLMTGGLQGAITANRKALEVARKEKDELDKQFTARNTERHETERKASRAIADLKETLADVEAKIAEIDKQIIADQNEIKAKKADPRMKDIGFRIELGEDKVKDLEKRPPECRIDACAFIEGALKAKASLPSLLKERRVLCETISREIEAKRAETGGREKLKAGHLQTVNRLRDEIKGIENTEIQLKSAHRETIDLLSKKQTVVTSRMDGLSALIEEEEKALARASQVASLKSGLDTATQRVQDLEQTILDAQEAIEKARKEHTKREQDKKTQIETLQKDLSDTKATFVEGVDEQIVENAKHLAAHNDSMRRAEDALLEAKTAVAGLQKDVEALERLNAEIAQLNDKKARFVKESAQWAYLKTGLGKDGLQALEIDSVAPMISGIANDLLSSTFGPSEQIRVETLTPDGKETFEVWVIRESGEVLLDDVSGGEEIPFLKALRLARTVIAKEKSGIGYQTFFSDEQDGAIRYGERSENFISLFRECMRIGKFSTAFYISHKPECIAMADHTILFENGSVTIQ